MAEYLKYADEDLYCHHILDEDPDPSIYKMHNHIQYEVYYFISGSGRFYVEGNEYSLQSGDVLIMRGTEAHYIVPEKGTPYERFALHFNRELLLEVDKTGALLRAFEDREAGKRNHFSGSDFKDDTYRRLLENMYDSTVMNTRLQVRTNLFALLNEIRIAFEETGQQKLPGRETLAGQVIAYVNHHLQEDLCLDELCNRFYISKPQLCRIFRKTTGNTVWGYITVKRLTKAQNLILSGTPATEACLKCGFSDYSAFYRAYRKRFHCPPNSDVHRGRKSHPEQEQQ